MTRIHFKRDKVKISEDGKEVQIPVEYLKQVGIFIENLDLSSEFIESDLRNINSALKYLAGKKEYNDWEDPLQTEKILIKQCPEHWWKWIVRNRDGD